jgi:predicted ATPase
MTQVRLESSRFQVLRTLGSGGMGVVYEAYDRQTDAVVAIKVLQRLNADSLFRFKQEFRALADLHHPNLLRFGELYCAQDQWFFTMERVHGRDFFDYVRIDDSPPAGRKRGDATDDDADAPTMVVPGDATALSGELSGSESFPRPPRLHRYDENRLRTAARQLAVAIAALHRSGRVHRDIKPSNVLVRDDGHLTLLDFGLIGEIGTPDEGAPAGVPPGLVIGTPNFMAPEQVTHENVGPAADWYAFGVLLFLALTGGLPFSGPPDVVIDAKRAVDGPAPSQLERDVPPDLDELCHALLKRTPGERPTADEILRCLGADNDAAPATLAKAAIDTPSLFIGRAAELAELRRAFGRTREGHSQLVLIEGEPGVGKSTLARRFVEHYARPSAVVLAGRCYEQESVPFKAFDTVIDSLSQHLASLPADAVIALLRSGIRYLPIIFPVLKRVPAVAERAPAARELMSTAMFVRERAFAELKRLLAALAASAPLVLLVDDLQWADQDSLALLESLFTGADVPCALLIATLRTTSLGSLAAQPGEPIVPRLSGLPFALLPLRGLSHEESQALWDALWTAGSADGAAPARDPGALLDEATGHPLFLTELVRHAKSDAAGPLAHARLQDVLWRRIAALDEPSRRFMELVAIAGAPVRYDVVAQAAGLDVTATLHLVGVLRTAQLVRVSRRADDRLVEAYHDRLREAILAHLHADEEPGSTRPQQLHLRLGRRLLEHTPDGELPAAVFTIVKHLNAATDLIDTRAERRRLAELNLLAARQAKLATAHAMALLYLGRGIALLGDEPWQTDHDLCRSLHWEQMEAEYLSGQRELALEHFSALLPRLTTVEERTDLYVSKIMLDTSQRRLRDAIASAREALAPLGVRLPQRARPASVLREYLATRWAQRGVTPETLPTLPEVQDPRLRSALKILDAIMPAAFFASFNLVAVISMRSAQISMRHGVSDKSAYCLAAYGNILVSAAGKLELGAALGEATLKLQERFRNPRMSARLLFMNGLYLTPWVKPFADAKAQLARACTEALQTGELAFEVYSTGSLALLSCSMGDPLAESHAYAESARAIALQRQDVDFAAMATAHLRYCAALRGLSPEPQTLGNEESSDEVLGQQFDTKQTPSGIFYYYFFNAHLAYLYGDLGRARAMLDQAERHLSGVLMPSTVEVRLLRVLVDARSWPEGPGRDRRERRRRMLRCQKQLRRLARLSPRNFDPMYRVACAEAARVLDPAKAAPLYAEAIALAGRHPGKWEALTLELAARFFDERGDPAAATQHRESAITAYARWGADAKARQLAPPA